MSRAEQHALVAWVNSFRPARRVTAFEQLADGKALMEVMAAVDSTHFKAAPTKGTMRVASPASGSSENWVLKSNNLKRLHRLLLSYPLPPPYPSPLSTSPAADPPPFSAIARSPTSPEGQAGLAKLCRLCLAVSVWAPPGNEQVIARIQRLEEGDMAELMRGIEEVMQLVGAGAGGEDEGGGAEGRGLWGRGESPVKTGGGEGAFEPDSPPISNLRVERDKLLQENDELRQRCEQMMSQVEELSSGLDEAKVERDEALERIAARLDSSAGPGAGLRSSQGASADINSLRADLAKAEESLAQTEADLSKQVGLVSEMTRAMEEMRDKAAEAGKLKDQLDEYRHAAEKLQKSENVIEKYKKKLEDSAGLRRELRSLEEENTSLVEANSKLEADLRMSGASKAVLENYKTQVEELEKRSSQQAAEITDLTHQLESTVTKLVEVEKAYERDREELQLHQDRARELDLGTSPGLRTAGSKSTLAIDGGATTLGDELQVDEDGVGEGETKTQLKLRIRALQRRLDEAGADGGGNGGHKVATLETLLADSNNARDRYQTEYLAAHRESLRLQMQLEGIRSGRGGDSAQTTAALRQRLDEALDDRDRLLREKEGAEVKMEDVERQLREARVDLSLVGKDERAMMASLRESLKSEDRKDMEEKDRLKDEVERLKEKDRMHLEEIKRLLMEKVELQSSGIDQRERALAREQEFGDLKASMAKSGVPDELQGRMLDMATRNAELTARVAELEKLAEERQSAFNGIGFEEAQQSYEAQIVSLRTQLDSLKVKSEAADQRYHIEQQLMLSAWHDLGSTIIRDHISHASVGRRSGRREMPVSWLGRQRRQQEDAAFAR